MIFMADNVNHPAHYQTEGGIECIDMIRSTLGKEGFVAYCRGNVLKYIVRYDRKGGVESLEKARWYLNAMIDAEMRAPVPAEPDRGKPEECSCKNCRHFVNVDLKKIVCELTGND